MCSNISQVGKVKGGTRDQQSEILGVWVSMHGKLRTSWGAQTLPVVMTNCYTIGVGRAGQGIFEFCMSDSRVGGGQVEGRVSKPWASPSVIYSGWSAPAR